MSGFREPFKKEHGKQAKTLFKALPYLLIPLKAIQVENVCMQNLRTVC